VGDVPDWSRRKPSAGCWNDGSIASALRKSAMAPEGSESRSRTRPRVENALAELGLSFIA